MDVRNDEQNDLFSYIYKDDDNSPVSMDISNSLKIVKASFDSVISADWKQLFEGFDDLYAITFSSGMDFVNKVVSNFKHAVIVFGCEGVMNAGTAAIIAMQAKVVQKYVKEKSARAMAERLEDGSL